MPITNLYFSNVGPFSEISFQFHPHVNVFTGPNNSGKSTALWVLAELLVYPFTLPQKMLRSDDPKWRLDITYRDEPESVEGTLPARVQSLEEVYKIIGHTSFVPAQRHSTDFRSPGPSSSAETYYSLDQEMDMWIQAQPAVVEKLGLEFARRTVKESRDREPPELAKRRNLMVAGASLMTDEAIIQKIIDLDYAAYREDRPAKRSIISKLFEVASGITEHFRIEFSRVEKDESGLYPEIRTPTQDLPYNVLSQGTKSIIQWIAHFLFGYAEFYDFPEEYDDKPGILIIDEIDAHLHPTWQGLIIPTLTKHFPMLQIFCSTHSPLMLAGLKKGQVQLLKPEENGSISVSTNETSIAGWTSDEILSGFMGVFSPTDMETAEMINQLHKFRHKEDITAEDANELAKLRYALNRQLLGGPSASQSEEDAEEFLRSRLGTRTEVVPTESNDIEEAHN